MDLRFHGFLIIILPVDYERLSPLENLFAERFEKDKVELFLIEWNTKFKLFF